MSSPFEPPTGPAGQGHAQPPYGAPPYPPPYPGPPRKSNTGLIIGIVAGIVVIAGIIATLFFTGAIGGGSKALGGGASSERVTLSRENLIGSWSSEGDCSVHVTQFLSNGEYWQRNYANPESHAPVKMGSWAISGSQIQTWLGSDGPGSNPFLVYNVNWISRDQLEATTGVNSDSGPTIWVRCPDALVPDNSGATGAAPAPTASAGPASAAPPPSTSASPAGGDTAARLQQAAAQFQQRLPINNGPVSITTVNAEGLTLRMFVSIRGVMRPENWTQMDTQLRPNICAGPFAAMIREGASAQVVMTDATSSQHTLTVSTC